jgi:hypothetical protein
MAEHANVVKLKIPVTFNGESIEQIELRRPKAADLVNAQDELGNPARQEAHLIAKLACVSATVIFELDAADYIRVQEVLKGFLS